MNPRTCIVTRIEKSPDEMVRFVLDPDGQVVPDLKRKLPGRGVWITANRTSVEKAVAKQLFSRGFKQPVKADPELVDLIENLLMSSVAGLLSMARKSGVLIAGKANVEDLIRADMASIVFLASDKDGDGRRKIEQLVVQSDPKPELCTFLDSETLDDISGSTNTAILALKNSGIAEKTGTTIERLNAFKN